MRAAAEITQTRQDTQSGFSHSGFSSGFTAPTWTVGSEVGSGESKDPANQGSESEVDQYQLLHPLGNGGMGELHLARTRGSKRLVAIKRIHDHLSHRTKIRKMFRDEANIAARIRHPNVVRVVDLKTERDRPYIAMEYIRGKTLADLVKRVRPPTLISAAIISRTAAGLHAAHELRDDDGRLIGTVHQDVSPQNIIIGYDGQVKLIDFGVARTRHTTYCGDIRKVRGKLTYMAPEQARAERIDRRVDLFALGVVLYEITTMTRLFKAKTEEEIRNRVLHGLITPPSQLVENYPPLLERIVLKALRRDPDRRYQTALQMHNDLEMYLGQRSRMMRSSISSLMDQVFVNQHARRQIEQRVKERLAAPPTVEVPVPPTIETPQQIFADDDEKTQDEHLKMMDLLADSQS